MAVRALICVLWDEADEDGDLDDGLEFLCSDRQPLRWIEIALGA